MGHAVYTISDPREKILKSYAQKLASEKGLDDEFALYDRVERIAGEEIMTHRKMLKPVCANVDSTADLFIQCEYSGRAFHTTLRDCTYHRVECASSGRTVKCR